MFQKTLDLEIGENALKSFSVLMECNYDCETGIEVELSSNGVSEKFYFGKKCDSSIRKDLTISVNDVNAF